MQHPVPALNRSLTQRQSEFVSQYVECGDPVQAAIASGYSATTAKAAGTEILNSPRVALEIARAARLRLARDVPMALGVLRHLAEHAASERVRMDSATRLLDRAGIVAPRPPDEHKVDLPLHEMPIDELREKVEKWLERAENDRGNRAKDVTPASPDPAEAELL